MGTPRIIYCKSAIVGASKTYSSGVLPFDTGRFFSQSSEQFKILIGGRYSIKFSVSSANSFRIGTQIMLCGFFLFPFSPCFV